MINQMDVNYQGLRLRLPDFLVVGAARSGTTSLCALLAEHPRIFFPAEKEPMFFSVFGQEWQPIDFRTRKQADFIINDLDSYERLFARAGSGQLLGEGSTWYLYLYNETIQNIKKIYGSQASALRILAVLRDPVERAWSHYWLKRRNGEEELPFEEAINPEVIQRRQEQSLLPGFDYLGFGRYYLQVKAYQESFEKTRIFLLEDLVREPAQTLAEVFRFLGLEPIRVINQLKRLNVAGAPKSEFFHLLERLIYRPHPLKLSVKKLIPRRTRARWKSSLSRLLFQPEPLPTHLRERLRAIYQEDIWALSHLINRDLSPWLG